METIDASPADLKLDDNVNKADGEIQNDQDQLITTRSKKKHKKVGHKEKKRSRKHEKYPKVIAKTEIYTNSSNADERDVAPKWDSVQIVDQQKRKHKKARSTEIETDARQKKKRKRNDSETNVDGSPHMIDKSSINTSPTASVSDSEQPDTIKKPNHKKSKTVDHNSFTQINAISPSSASITDIMHSEWRISKERMSDLKSKGIVVKNGKWTTEENELIEANINCYMKEYGVEDRDKLLFKRHDAPTSKAEMYRSFAQGIHRELHAIYRHILRIYHPSYGKEISSDEMAHLRSLYALHGNDWKTIAKAMGQSNYWVEHKIRYLEQKNLASNAGKWSEEEVSKLQSAVSNYVKDNAASDHIPWSKVAKHIGTRNANQCRSRWLFTNKNAAKYERKGKMMKWGHLDIAKLYLRISEMNPQSENDIDWNHIAKNWHRPCYPEFLALKWSKIKAKVPKDNQRNLTEILSWLQESEYLKAINNKVGSRLEEL